MKLVLINILFIVFISMNVLGQVTGANEVRKGNFDYKMESYDKAEEHYRKSLSKGIGSIEGMFNLGNALYKQKKYEESAKVFKSLTENVDDPILKAKAYHNLGNSLMNADQLEPAINAYKNALRLNPNDEETRNNLMLALRKLQKQEQNKDQNKDDQEKEQKDQEKDKQDQKQDQQQNKDQEQKKEEEKQDQQNDQKKNEQQEKQEQSQPKPNQISKEEAQRMLDALDRNEKDIQDKLKMKKIQGKKEDIEKDW